MKHISLALIGITFLIACNKQESAEVEIQTTINISDIDITSALVSLSGQVLSSNDSYNWGVAYSINPDPRMDNKRTMASTNGNSIYESFTISGLLPDSVHYVQPFVEVNNQYYFGEQIVEFRTDTLPFQIGELGPAGGLVYYIDIQEGWAMEMSTTTSFDPNSWGCSDNVNGTLREIGSGENNSSLILSTCSETSTAVTICDAHTEGGFSDWHLPAVDDLAEIDSNLVSTGIWDPVEYAHASSTQGYDVSAYLMYQWSGSYVFWNYKTYDYHFLPVRRFEF